jgi:hypothetical protein
MACSNWLSKLGDFQADRGSSILGRMQVAEPTHTKFEALAVGNAESYSTYCQSSKLADVAESCAAHSFVSYSSYIDMSAPARVDQSQHLSCESGDDLIRPALCLEPLNL